MAIIDIQPARREGAHLLISLTGASGSGKTYSAILLARGLVGPDGKIGLLDTESGRGRLYANLTPYHHAELTPPFSPRRFITSIEEFEAARCHALIIDSTSMEWEGSGGVLEMADATGKQGVLKWAMPKAQHKKFVNAILQSRMHVICCMRARKRVKQVYDAEKGKDTLVDAGYHEIQNDHFIYEMTVSAFLHSPNNIELTKCPDDLKPIFPRDAPINVETGRRLAEWVAGGAPSDPVFEAVRSRARAVADEGTTALETWWRTLTNDHKRRLHPEMDNLKSIASEADERAKEEAP